MFSHDPAHFYLLNFLQPTGDIGDIFAVPNGRAEFRLVNDSLKVWIKTRNLSPGLPTRSDTNRAVQPQKMARGLKFGTEEVEGL